MSRVVRRQQNMNARSLPLAAQLFTKTFPAGSWKPSRHTFPTLPSTSAKTRMVSISTGRSLPWIRLPLLRAPVGSMQHWRVVNATREVHPFHIHQVHFLAYAINDVASEMPEWLDTVNVPYGGTVDLIMDFTDPVIRGASVFHCHLLSHEDKGMMAKIVFEGYSQMSCVAKEIVHNGYAKQSTFGITAGQVPHSLAHDDRTRCAEEWKRHTVRHCNESRLCFGELIQCSVQERLRQSSGPGVFARSFNLRIHINSSNPQPSDSRKPFVAFSTLSIP